MKKYIIIATSAILLFSCNKVEEKFDEVVTKTTETAKKKAQEAVSETISNSINSITNTENAQFSEVFPGADAALIKNFSGRKFIFPNGSPAYFFKYEASPTELLPFLESRPTADEEKSDKTAKKINGEKILSKINFISKFLPEGMMDSSFINDLKTDNTIEYYELKRYPNKSTLIYRPKTETFYQFVEIDK